MKIVINKGLMSGCYYDTKTKNLHRQNSDRVVPKDGNVYLLKVNGKVVRITQIQIANYLHATKHENQQHLAYIISAEDMAFIKEQESKNPAPPARTAKEICRILDLRKQAVKDEPVDFTKEIASIREEIRRRKSEDIIGLIKSLRGGRTVSELETKFGIPAARIVRLAKEYGVLLEKKDKFPRLTLTRQLNSPPKRGRKANV